MSENKPLGVLDVMAADEIHSYFKAKRAVNDDEELSNAIREYEAKSKRLTEMLGREKEYDPEEALQLANDVDVLAGILEGNSKINELKLAYAVMNRYLATVKNRVSDSGEAVVSFSCTGECSQCKSACSAADIITQKGTDC